MATDEEVLHDYYSTVAKRHLIDSYMDMVRESAGYEALFLGWELEKQDTLAELERIRLLGGETHDD